MAKQAFSASGVKSNTASLSYNSILLLQAHCMEVSPEGCRSTLLPGNQSSRLVQAHAREVAPRRFRVLKCPAQCAQRKYGDTTNSTRSGQGGQGGGACELRSAKREEDG